MTAMLVYEAKKYHNQVFALSKDFILIAAEA
jgi:hypothetical protein